MKITSVADTALPLKLLVYGDPGVGKTTLAASANQHPKMEGTLFLNVEGGMLSVRGTGVKSTDQVSSVAEAEELMMMLARGAKELEGIQTVVIDSGTELQTLDLAQIAAHEARKKTDRSIDVLHMQDYGLSTRRMSRIFRSFRDLPQHVIVTALVKRIVPEGASKPALVQPSFTAKLSTSVCGYMDMVWFMQRQGEDRMVLTQESMPYVAKTRGNRFAAKIGQVVKNPDLSELYETLLQTEGQ